MGVESILIGIALVVGFYMAWNIGANDVSNAMGTSVGSGALTMKQAVCIAAVLEFSGAYFFGSHVSDTIQKGIVNPELFMDKPFILVYGMIASLMAAGAWLQIATYYGWPVSTTHSIIGAIVGFGIVVGGPQAVHWSKISYIVLSWVLSPLMGGLLAYITFSFLRRQIFYSHEPLKMAKKLSPFLFFFVTTSLTMVILFKGLKNLHLEFTFLQALFISSCVGSVAFLINRFFIKKIKVTKKKQESKIDPQMIVNLDKVKKLLKKSKKQSPQKFQFALSMALSEVDDITESIENETESRVDENEEQQAVENIFRYLQIMTACCMAFSHGANDVANAIGPLSAAITILRDGIVNLKTTISPWILALGGFGIILGLATWGWRVIETIGKKITELTPSRGFAAEFGAATTLVFASRLGLPVSTTHTLVGAVLGVGWAGGIGSLNLSMVKNIFSSWVITIPVGAILSIIFYYLLLFSFSPLVS